MYLPHQSKNIFNLSLIAPDFEIFYKYYIRITLK